jgi:hypothetical protein
MNRILNSNEIKSLLQKAQDPVYKLQGVICFSSKNHPLDIIKISPKGLIFIEGNDQTGFKHISERHNYYSGRIDWIDFKDSNGGIIEKRGKHREVIKNLDNPSRFSPNSIPIFDYVKIADDIFCAENYCLEKNKEKELFDLFIGYSKSINNVKYRLITYKDSKIVHTLFPDDNKSKKDKTLNYSKGKLIGVYMPDAGPIISIELPYYDHKRIERFKLIIRRDHDSGHEKIYIQKNLINGQPFLVKFIGERDYLFKGQLTSYLMRLQFADFIDIEKEIKKLDS